MKTRKLWSLLMALVLTFAAPTFFSSCSNDDDEQYNHENVISSLCHGFWTYKSEIGREIQCYFYPDRSGKVGVEGAKPGQEGAWVWFTFSVKNNKLHIVTEDGMKGTFTFTMIPDESNDFYYYNMLVEINGETKFFNHVVPFIDYPHHVPPSHVE